MSTMKGKVCTVTGSNSGIGKETALALASMGATVVMVVRSRERGEAARADIIEKTDNSLTDLMICDLSLMDSIRQFAEAFKNKYDRVDVLVNNAGAVFQNRQVTVDGFELTLAVNYLAPFLLTNELLPLLRTSAPSRVINLTSGLHKSGKIDFEDIQSEDNYNGMSAYRNAKLMIVMFTYELARRLERTGVTVNVAHPGFAATNLGRNTGSLRSSLMFKLMRPFQVSAKKAAETSVYLSSSLEVEGVTGKYFRRKQEAPSAPVSYDTRMQKRLWDTTVELLGLARSIDDRVGTGQSQYPNIESEAAQARKGVLANRLRSIDSILNPRMQSSERYSK